MTYFTKETFFEFISGYKIPGIIKEKFWVTRPNGHNVIDENLIIENAKRLEKHFEDCEECEEKETCSVFTAKTIEELEADSLFPQHMKN